MSRKISTPLLVKDEPNVWQQLADAIILQAVKDYRGMVRLINRIKWNIKRKHYSPEEKTYQFQRIEYYKREQDKAGDFFLSDWFAAMTTIDGYDLLSRLEREAEE